MARFRFRSRIAAWMALGNLAFNAFWPLLANARPGAAPLPAEICSATGLRHAGGEAPADTPDRSVRPSHCTLCPFNADRTAAALPDAALTLADSGASEARPGFFEAAPPDSPLDPTAPPRAPPLSS
jgi:hypothetical protein